MYEIKSISLYENRKLWLIWGIQCLSGGFILPKKEFKYTRKDFKRSTNVIRLIVFMMIIPLIILIDFYASILNGFDQSVQFLYFLMIVIISVSVYGIMFIKDKWRYHGRHIDIICLILVISIVFGLLSFGELNKVEVNIINPSAGASVHTQFEISGLFENIPENRDIWLYTFDPINQRYYPEPFPVTKVNNGHSGSGSWSYCCMVNMNRFKAVDKSFQIGIFISNKKDRNRIKQKIKSVNADIKGMNYLPNEVEDRGIKLNVNIV